MIIKNFSAYCLLSFTVETPLSSRWDSRHFSGLRFSSYRQIVVKSYTNHQGVFECIMVEEHAAKCNQKLVETSNIYLFYFITLQFTIRTVKAQDSCQGYSFSASYTILTPQWGLYSNLKMLQEIKGHIQYLRIPLIIYFLKNHVSSFRLWHALQFINDFDLLHKQRICTKVTKFISSGFHFDTILYPK